MARVFLLTLFIVYASYVRAAIVTAYLQLLGAPNRVLRDGQQVKSIIGSKDLTGAIPINGFTLGVSVSRVPPAAGGPVVTGGEGVSKAVFSSFTFTKRVDGNTPLFQQYAETGIVLSRGFVLTLVNGPVEPRPGEPRPFASSVYYFGNVAIQNQEIGGTAEDVTESVTVAYGLLGVTYNLQTTPGVLGSSYSTCWDQVLNRSGTGCVTGV